MKRLKWLSNKIVELILLLNLTSLYALIAIPFGSVFYVTVLMGVGIVTYFVFHLYTLRNTAKNKQLLTILTLVSIWPSVNLMVTSYGSVEATLLQYYNGMLIIAFLIYSTVNKERRISALGKISFSILVFFTVLSFIWPTFFLFREIAQVLNAEKSLLGSIESNRAFGLIIQPNMNSVGIIFSFLLWIGGLRLKTFKTIINKFSILIITLILTGSRAAILIGLFLLAYYLFKLLRNKNISKGLATSSTITLFSISVLFLTLLLFLYEDLFSSLISRMASLFNIFSSDINTNAADGSVSIRLLTVQQYFDLIIKEPWVGYGIKATKVFQAKGQLFIESHNLFIEKAFEFGLPYIIVLLGFITSIYLKNKKYNTGYNKSFVNVSLIIILTLTLKDHLLLEQRPVLILIGYLIYKIMNSPKKSY